jgi:hypothetical protein
MKSESLKELGGAMCKAQASIKGALKDSSNPFFKSKYADLSSVVEAIRTPLSDNGLSYIQVSHDAKDAACIETVILHSSGEWFSCGPVSVPVSKADAQGFGSAMTYARRYSLSAAFGVAPEDDDGNEAAKSPPKIAQNIDQEVALATLSTEAIAELRREAKGIEGDFYTLSVKAAVERYNSFKASANHDEIEGLWSFLDSKVRNGMKRFKEGVAA